MKFVKAYCSYVVICLFCLAMGIVSFALGYYTFKGIQYLYSTASAHFVVSSTLTQYMVVLVGVCIVGSFFMALADWIQGKL